MPTKAMALPEVHLSFPGGFIGRDEVLYFPEGIYQGTSHKTVVANCLVPDSAQGTVPIYGWEGSTFIHYVDPSKLIKNWRPPDVPDPC